MKFQATVLSLFAASAMAVHVEQALLNTDNMVLLMDDGEHFEFAETAVIEDEEIMKKTSSTKAAKKTVISSAAPSTTVKKDKSTSVAASSSATKTKSKSHTASVTKTNGGAQVAGSVAAPLALIAGLLL